LRTKKNLTKKLVGYSQKNAVSLLANTILRYQSKEEKMRIAAISDIHSNVFALDAVITDIKKREVDLTVNLGDILYGPIAPRSTYDLLMDNNFITICGNQDRQIFEATKQDINSNPTMQFILDDLGQEPLEWMRSLPFDKQLSQEVYLCHGTPSDDLIYLLEDVESGFARMRPDSEILDLLNGQSSDVILCGHTHTARTACISTNQLIVNTGSVGLPAYNDDEPVVHTIESYSPHASYAIVERVSMGWNVQHIKVAYDYNSAAEKAQRQNREDWVHFLTTGRG
jgi:predicted phosphodiesterase